MTHIELQDAFIELTFILRGFDYNDLNSDDQNLVKLSYQVDSQPFQDLLEDISYVWVNFANSRHNNQINEILTSAPTDTLKSNKSQLRTITSHWTFYGGNAQDIAHDFRQRIFGNEAKDFLDLKDIKLIPDVPEVILNYEEVNGRWWSRIDLIVDYYLTTKFDEELGIIESVTTQLSTEKEDIIIN